MTALLNPSNFRLTIMSPIIRNGFARITRLRTFAQCRSHSTGSVDPNEITHFTALAADWWSPHGSSRLLHLMNPLRLQFLRSCLARGTPERADGAQKLRFLDVGCGGGILAESLARLGTTESVVAIDPTPQVLEIAAQHMRRDPALQGKLRYLNTTIDGLEAAMAGAPPAGTTLFDVVCPCRAPGQPQF